MTFSQYETLFRDKAKKLAWSEDEISACLDYARPLVERRLPVIYNTANLAALVGYRSSYLKRAVKFTTYYYREFLIRKRSGKPRKIVEPLPSLKEIQNWILENILSELPVSKFAKAYIKDRTLIDNVKFHKGRDFILTLDIRDFFNSIKLESIEEIFRKIGYSSNLSNLFAKLCTYENSLPQGAPTSPYLSNLYLRSFDTSISEYCVNRNIRYTRYADDLTFSGTFDAPEITKFIETELNKILLDLNIEKKRLMHKGVRQIVTGIVVNEKIQIPKSDRNFIRNEVHYLSKFGLKEHLERTKNKKANYIQHLLGKINFALHINPTDKRMQKYREQVITYAKIRDGERR